MCLLAEVSEPTSDDLWTAPQRGNAAAQGRLLAAFCDEFRMIARRVLRGDCGQLALQPTDLAVGEFAETLGLSESTAAHRWFGARACLLYRVVGGH